MNARTTTPPPRVTALAILLAVAAQPQRTLAFVRSRVDAETERYLYWPDRRIEVDVDETGNPDVDPAGMRSAVLQSLEEWSSPDCTDLELLYGAASTTRSTNLLDAGAPDLENQLVWRHDDWPEDLGSDVGAVTTLVFDVTGVILDGDVDMNGAGFSWTTGDDSPGIDVESNVTHEIGHLIGLDHTADREATMYYSMVEGDLSRRDLAENDLAGVCFVYPAGEPTPEGTLPEEEDGSDGAGRCAAVPGRTAGPSSWVVALLLLLAARVGLRKPPRGLQPHLRPPRAGGMRRPLGGAPVQIPAESRAKTVERLTVVSPRGIRTCLWCGPRR